MLDERIKDNYNLKPLWIIDKMLHLADFMIIAHKNKICHCDIKLSNFILKDDKLYIIDFGAAAQENH